jgi:hypothetical protein
LNLGYPVIWRNCLHHLHLVSIQKQTQCAYMMTVSFGRCTCDK